MTKSVDTTVRKAPRSVRARLRADFDATRAERDAVDPEGRCTFDLSAAYVLVSGALPALRGLEGSLKRSLPEFDVALLQKIEVYGRAALYAQGVDRSTTQSNSEDHAKLVDELESLYQRLYRNGVFLAEEGLFKRSVIENARTGTSVRDRAADLRTLAIEFAASETALAGRTFVTRETIARAFEVAQAVLDSLAARGALTEERSRAQRDRHRAALLFYRAWNEIRRAVLWLRWNEGDADKFAPSFHSLKARRPSRGDAATDPREPDAPITKAPSEPPAPEA